MAIRKTLLFLLLLAPFALSAQDTIVMINGNIKIVDVAKVDQRMLYLTYRKVNSHREKPKAMALTDVFSVSFKDSVRQITYVQDSNLGLDMPVEDMSSYVSGERYAVEHYKAPWATVGGAVAGAAGPFVLNYFLGLLLPAAYTATVAPIPVSTRKLAKQEPSLYADPLFVAGYKQRAKHKKALNAIYGSLIGIGASSIAIIVITATK
jgi:hypothetical protein